MTRPVKLLLILPTALFLFCGPAFATQYAVLFSGGGLSWHYNYWCFFNETKRIYNTLIDDYGYLEQNIYVLHSDGLSTGRDREYVTTYDPLDHESRDTPHDIDGDGDDDIWGAGTQADLQDALDELATKITQDDFFLFWGADHGAKDGNNYETDHTYLVPWQYSQANFDDFIQDAELDAWCDAKIAAERQVHLFGQCYSGGFINDMQQDGRVVFTSATHTEYSYGDGSEPSSDDDYMGYMRAWWEAVDLDANGDPKPGVDTDGDGRVCMDEARAYAWAHDPFANPDHPDYDPSCTETPQFSDLGGYAPILDLYGRCPEPASSALFVLGLALLALRRRRPQDRV